MVRLAEYRIVGDGLTFGNIGMGWISVDWMADDQGGMAKAYFVVGLGSDNFHLAIFDL